MRFGKSKLKLLSEDQYYENTINPNNGADWNQIKPTDNQPKIQEYQQTISDYLAWEISEELKASIEGK